MVIPVMKSDTSSRRETAASATSRSSMGSSTRDNSIGYDTPTTTTGNTPAMDGCKTSGRRNFNLGGISLNSSNKRKRGSQAAPAQSIDTSRDEELARTMQEEEYGPSAVSEAGPSSTRLCDRKRNFIDLKNDSDDEKPIVEVTFVVPQK